jgi:alkylation response protein AidB-like acyl-CoA dehydrogenase
VARAGDEQVAVSVLTSAVDLQEVNGLDPTLGLLNVSGLVSVDAEPEPITTWESGAALGQLAIAHELIGASRKALDLACEHARERSQFGKPIAGFQAVRHRLADVLVAIEAADAGLEAAWLDGTAQSATIAKALAGRGTRTAVRNCQQVLAGIGFTTEHPFHHYARRMLVLDELLGSTRSLTTALGETALITRQLPVVHAL